MLMWLLQLLMNALKTPQQLDLLVLQAEFSLAAAQVLQHSNAALTMPTTIESSANCCVHGVGKHVLCLA